MVTREARSASGDRLGGAALDDLGPAADRRPVELVRPFLRPAQAALLAEDLDVEPVHPPHRDGARPQAQRRAVLHAEIDHRVVFERASLRRRRRSRRRVRAAGCRARKTPFAAHGCHNPRIARRGRPERDRSASARADCRHRAASAWKPCANSALTSRTRAEIAARHHRPHVAHKRIAGIAVVDGEGDAGALARRG